LILRRIEGHVRVRVLKMELRVLKGRELLGSALAEQIVDLDQRRS
jgi:hypothetical protein